MITDMIELVKNQKDEINYVNEDEAQRYSREMAVHTCAFKFNLLKRELVETYGCEVEVRTNYDLYGKGKTEWYTISKTGFELTAQIHFQDRNKRASSDYVRIVSLEAKICF